MLLVNFKSWKSSYILVALVVITLFFAFLMPQTQKSKNLELYAAVVENNITQARQSIQKGAQTDLLLPQGYPILSVAIEYENQEMLALLLKDETPLKREYEGYNMITHASQKKNKNLLILIVEALEKDRKRNRK